MKELNIKNKEFIYLRNITKLNDGKEVCAFIFSSNWDDNHTISEIIQVRNKKRGESTFGISRQDYDYHYTKDLIGIYHSHALEPILSEKDKTIFLKHENIKIQLIGYYNKALFDIKCYSDKLENLKINIL